MGEEYNEWDIRVVGVDHGSARSGTKEWTIFPECVWNIFGAAFKKILVEGVFGIYFESFQTTSCLWCILPLIIF